MINHEDVNLFLDFLNYDNYYFQTFKPRIDGEPQTGVISQGFYDKKGILEQAKKDNGKGLVCVALNERPKGKTKGSDVQNLGILVIDIDVKDSRKKGYCSTKEDNEYAVKIAYKVKDFLNNEFGIKTNMVTNSGNGSQVLAKLNIPITDPDELKSKLTVIEERLSVFNDDVIEIDCITKDINRRLKIPGTINKKDTHQVEDRICKILEYVKPTPEDIKLNSEALLKIKPLTIESSLKKIEEKSEFTLTDLTRICEKDQKLKDLLNQSSEEITKKYEYKSRSEIESAIIIKLLYYKVPEKKIEHFLNIRGFGWEEKPQEYRNLTMKKAKEFFIKKKIAERRDKHEQAEQFLFDDNKGNEKVSIDEVSDYIMSMIPIKTIYETKSEIMWSYEEGIWKNDGRKTVQAMVEELLGSYCKNNIVSEIVGKIKRSTAISREEFNTTPKKFICLNNGLLNLKTLEFKEHSQEYYFKAKMPIGYNKKAKCPTILKFIEETFYEEDIPVIQEWIGFCLFDEYFIKKALILFGETNTGKTVFMNLLTAFIGDKNISGLSLQVISGGNKFQLATLENKKVNPYDDISNKDLKSTGGFKMATGGGWITAEHKFGDTFQFKNFGKLTFTCNKIPDVEELEDRNAYYGRWIPIPCDMQIPIEQQDNFLINKLTTQKELSGLLNWVLEGLQRLFKKKSFSFKKTINEIESIMIRHTNSLSSFCEEILFEDTGHKITKQDLFDIYTFFCQAREIKRRLSLKQLSNRLPKRINYCLSRQGNKRYWSGININWSILDDLYDLKTTIEKISYREVKRNITKGQKEPTKPSNMDAEVDAFIQEKVVS